MHSLSQAIDQCQRHVRRLDAPMCGRVDMSLSPESYRIFVPERSTAGERFFCYYKERYVIFCNFLSPNQITSCDGGGDIWGSTENGSWVTTCLTSQALDSTGLIRL